MKTLLKKGHHGVIAQLFSLDVQTSIASSPMDLQKVINNHSKVFGEMPKGLPPSQDHAHVIHLQPISLHPIFHVSWLKKILSDMISMKNILSEINREGNVILEPGTIL